MVAVDRSLAMIRSVWPGRVSPRDESVCAVWEAMPLETGSIDVVLGDGTLSTLSFPGDYAIVSEEVGRVLRDGGFWVVRTFIQSAVPETVEAVLKELDGERTGGFHAFKWRLAMALQEDAETGVAVSDIRRTLLEAEPDLHALARRRGWRVEEIRTIEAYRDVRARYTFPRRVRIEAMFRNAGFEIVEIVDHSYELGDRCPTYVLAPRVAT